MKRGFLISIIFFVATNVSLGQESVSLNNDTTNSSFSLMYFQIGIATQKYDKLNTVLKDNGFASLGQNSFSVGGGYQYLSKSNIINLSDFNIYMQSASEQNNTTKIKAFEIAQNFGYTFINDTKFQLISFGGLAYTWLSIKMFNKIPNNTTVGNFLSGTANQFEMSASYWSANFGGQFTFSPTIDKKTGDKLIIGIKSNYTIPISETDWTMDNVNLKDGPKIDNNKLFVGFVIGITI